MGNLGENDIREALKGLREFRSGKTNDRIFEYPTGHPSSPTGFCFCDKSVLKTTAVCIRGGILAFVLKLPFNRPKVSLLRKMGAKIGKNVYISAGVWIDPVYTDLLTIEDNVMIGMFATIVMHEFRINGFRAGKVILREGSLIGGNAAIRCGVEVGAGATVAAGTVLGKDVPPGAIARGNPARIINKGEKDAEK